MSSRKVRAVRWHHLHRLPRWLQYERSWVEGWVRLTQTGYIDELLEDKANLPEVNALKKDPRTADDEGGADGAGASSGSGAGGSEGSGAGDSSHGR